MGRNSDFYKKKKDKQIDKFNELSERLPNFVYNYLREIRDHREPSTLVAYSFDLLTFFEYLIQHNPLCRNMTPRQVPLEVMEHLTARDFDEYMDYLRNKGGHSNNNQSISRKMTPIRGWYDYAVRYGDIAASPISGKGIGDREKKSDIIRLTVNQVNELVKKVQYTEVSSKHAKAYCEKTKQRDNALINLLLYTGIRVSEAQGLDMDDLDFKENRISVVRKGGKESYVYFQEDTAALLLEYINGERLKLAKGNPDERALFLSIRHSRMCVKAIENLVKKYTREVTGNGKITCHKLRTTFGTNLYQKTSDIRLVADTLGHSSVNTTAKHYSAVEEEHRRKAANIDLYGKNGEPDVPS